jgi:hypothetical protein
MEKRTWTTVRNHLLVCGFRGAGGRSRVLSSDADACDTSRDGEEPKEAAHAAVCAMRGGAEDPSNNDEEGSRDECCRFISQRIEQHAIHGFTHQSFGLLYHR